MSRFIIFICAALVLQSCKSDSATQSNTTSTQTPVKGAISGRISSVYGQYLAGTAIALQGVPKTVTDTTGKYVIPNVTAGVYFITATKSSYQIAGDSVTVSDGRVTTWDAILVPQ